MKAKGGPAKTSIKAEEVTSRKAGKQCSKKNF